MFRLSPIKLWKNISVIIFLIAIIFTLIGTFTIHDELVVHWNSVGVPNNSSGKWILWAMLLLAFLSMFTHSSFSKKAPGTKAIKYGDVRRFFVWTGSYVDYSDYNIGNLQFLSNDSHSYYWYNRYWSMLYFARDNRLYSKQERCQVVSCRAEN